ncbi:MAG: gliding motility-associated C-terminal domain-containing protein [Bacteroidota bacterium]
MMSQKLFISAVLILSFNFLFAQILSVSITDTVIATCNGFCDGSATATPAGGTQPYTYLWDDPLAQTDSIADSLCAGIYPVRVIDAVPDTAYDTVTISQPNILYAGITNSTNILCNGDSSGSATVTPNGGNTAQTFTTAPGANIINGCANIVTSTQTISGYSGNIFTSDIKVEINITHDWDDDLIVYIAAPNGDVLNLVLYEGGNGDNFTNTVFWDGAALSVVGQPAPFTGSFRPEGFLGTICGSVTSNATTFSAIGGGTINPNGDWSLIIYDNALGWDGILVDWSIAFPATIGGTPPYTYSWTLSDTIALSDSIADPTGLPAGIYQVIVNDSNSCSDSATVTITQPTTLSVSITGSTNVLCNGDSTATATATATGGIPPYTYSWMLSDTIPLSDSIADPAGLSAGTYKVVVNDSNGCTDSASVILVQPTLFSVSITDSTNVLCSGDSTATATATAAGGIPPYTYSWDNGDSTDALQSVSAGSYTIIVNDSNSCTDSATVTITQPTILSVNITDSTNVLCNGDSTGTVTATAIGGVAPYTYSWTLSDTIALSDSIADPAGLPAGTYKVIVNDSNSCADSATITITQPSALSVSITDTTHINCGDICTGAAIATPAGGIPPYTYTWDTTPAQTDSTATGLCAGTYTATVAGANGCYSTLSVIITGPDNLTSAISDTTNTSCAGVCDGLATVTVSGGSLPYTYSWEDSLGVPIPGETDSIIVSVCAGNYNAVITDNNGCITTTPLTITQPPIFTSSITNSTDASCYGICDGTATVTASGGTPPYAYLWDNPLAQTDTTATGLCAGTTYYVAITDANGCFTVSSIMINEPAELTVSITDTTHVSCNGLPAGTATATPVGGTPPYTYLWGPVSQPDTATADSLGIGDYWILVTDSNGCTVIDSVSIRDTSNMDANITNVEHVQCNGDCNGEATVSASEGTPPYFYTWIDLSIPDSIPGETDSTISGLCAGNYLAVVIDNDGCFITTPPININEPATFSASITWNTGISCFGDTGGSATVSLTNGIQPFDYMWTSGDTLLGSIDTTHSVTGLAPGIYFITIIDSNNCLAMDSVIITEPPLLTATINDSTGASCGGVCDGTATVMVSGGISPYTYFWDNPGSQTDSFADSLCIGVNSVTITDVNGCDTIVTVTITGPPVLTSAITNIINVPCYGGCDGEASVTATGGASPYTYSWLNGDTTPTADSLCGGTYSVTVTDANSCIAIDSVMITEPPLLIAEITDSAAVCGAACDGYATVAPTGGTLPYIYLWSNYDTTITADSLCGGVETVIVTDANGCSDTGSVIIVADTLPLTADAGNDTTVCEGESITLNASGGNFYNWSPSVKLSCTDCQSPEVSPISTTTYTVTVTNLACFKTDTIIVRVEFCDCETIEPIPQVITPNEDGKNDQFEIPNLDIFPGNELTIFNRWGNIVFSTGSYSNDWKGESNRGEGLPDGSYFYIIDLGKEKCQGYVMIHR